MYLAATCVPSINNLVALILGFINTVDLEVEHPKQ